jgi:hypothetical protein
METSLFFLGILLGIAANSVWQTYREWLFDHSAKNDTLTQQLRVKNAYSVTLDPDWQREWDNIL